MGVELNGELLEVKFNKRNNYYMYFWQHYEKKNCSTQCNICFCCQPSFTDVILSLWYDEEISLTDKANEDVFFYILNASYSLPLFLLTSVTAADRQHDMTVNPNRPFAVIMSFLPINTNTRKEQ